MTKPFTDHFAGVSPGYASFRPTYPPGLFDALVDIAPSTALAWDAGAGSGQASVALGHRFARVVATDASASQIERATPHARVEYRVAPAHQSGLEDASVGLITVAQALHWFDVDAFHAEAERVLAPNGIIAEWSYGLLDIPTAPRVAEMVNALDRDVGAHWPPERKHVDDRYAALAFPFEPVNIGEFAMENDWTLEQLAGYLGTWSAVSRYRTATGSDPLADFIQRAGEGWGRAPVHRVRWPLALRVGRYDIKAAAMR